MSMSAPPRAEQNALWRNRIVAHGHESPDQLLAHPQNWRVHPTEQQQVTGDVLDAIGWVREVLVNVTTQHVVDGHLRIDLALRRGETSVPVTYIEVSESEEKVLLATLDTLCSRARSDAEVLIGLLTDVGSVTPGLDTLFSELARVVMPGAERAQSTDATLPCELRVRFASYALLAQAVTVIGCACKRTKRAITIEGDALLGALRAPERASVT